MQHNNVREYWAKVRAIRDMLSTEHPEGPVYIVPVQNTYASAAIPQNVVVADVDVAARCLAEGGHRKATPDEIEAYEQTQAAARKAATDRQMAQRVVYMVPQPEPQATVAAPAQARKAQ